MTLPGSIPHTSLQRQEKQSTLLTFAASWDTLYCHFAFGVFQPPQLSWNALASTAHSPSNVLDSYQSTFSPLWTLILPLQTSHGHEAQNDRRHPALRKVPQRRNARRRKPHTYVRASTGTILLEVSRRLSTQRWVAFAQLPQG